MCVLAIFGYRILDVDKRWMIFRSASLPAYQAEPNPNPPVLDLEHHELTQTAV